MITEQDLIEAIDQYERVDNPTAQTCITLAAFYAVKDHLYPEEVGQSYDGEPIIYSSDTEFGQVVGRLDVHSVLSLMDELMETTKILNPPLYDSVMQKLSDT